MVSAVGTARPRALRWGTSHGSRPLSNAAVDIGPLALLACPVCGLRMSSDSPGNAGSYRPGRGCLPAAPGHAEGPRTVSEVKSLPAALSHLCSRLFPSPTGTGLDDTTTVGGNLAGCLTIEGPTCHLGELGTSLTAPVLVLPAEAGASTNGQVWTLPAEVPGGQAPPWLCLDSRMSGRKGWPVSSRSPEFWVMGTGPTQPRGSSLKHRH